MNHSVFAAAAALSVRKASDSNWIINNEDSHLSITCSHRRDRAGQLSWSALLMKKQD
jgi:hypothetical protein